MPVPAPFSLGGSPWRLGLTFPDEIGKPAAIRQVTDDQRGTRANGRV